MYQIECIVHTLLANVVINRANPNLSIKAAGDQWICFLRIRYRAIITALPQLIAKQKSVSFLI
ncbi:hypothetical protein PFLUOLIPICF7_19185 [Pseudomonas simiae]|nr:hypothetical protein PFLUOLIPICF7_19185 [Pseudomonas simiae]